MQSFWRRKLKMQKNMYMCTYCGFLLILVLEINIPGQQKMQLCTRSTITVFSPQGGDQEHRVALPVWRAGPTGAFPGIYCALLGQNSRHHQWYPRGLDHQLLPHHHGALLPSEEEPSYNPHPGPPFGAGRYHPALMFLLFSTF